MVSKLGRRFKQLYRQGPISARRQEMHLSKWYQTSLGQELINYEKDLIRKAISGRFGSLFVQLDSGLHQPLFDQRLFGSGILVSYLENRALCPTVCAQPESLPLLPESVDMILMHHTLDVCDNPYQAVREASVALKPGGLMIVLGFNPFSLWGVRAVIQGSRQGLGVWNSRFIRCGRVEDWMNLLNFDLERNEKQVFIPPFSRPKWLPQVSIAARIQKSILPVSGSVYLLVGCKQQLGKLPMDEKLNAISFLDKVSHVNSKRRV